MADPQIAPFQGFSAKAFAFLKELDATQSREWFEANKATYEAELRGPLSSLVASLGLALTVEGLELQCDPKRALFRIHRDVRFSKDKRPYKGHVSASLTRDGERMAPGLLYIHIDPKACFIASGFFRPEPPVLQKIRARIVAKPKEIRAVVAGLEKAKLPFREDEPMKRTPRGFEAVQDEDLLALLRRKTLVVRRDVSRKTAADADALIAAIASFAKDAHPLLKFGWAALAG